MASGDQDATRADADRPTQIGSRQIVTVLCMTVGTWAYAYTWNSVGVALPHMQGAFSATTDQITWVMIAFVIGGAMATASTGWLSAQFGRKRLYLAAIAGYTVTLLGCGLSTTLTEEVFWRFVQGVTGAPLLPLGQAIAVNAFPAGRHGQATSLWALGFVTGNVVAPTLSGHLIDQHGWPWIFYVNVPIGIAVFIAAWFLVPRSEKAPRPLDWLGFTSLIVGVGALQLMLARGERLDWFASTEIVVEAAIAATALYVFIAHTLTARKSFVDKSLFLDRNFGLGLFFIFLVGAVFYLPLLLLPLLLQQIGGYPAVETGNLLLARGVGSIIGLMIMSQIRDRYDPRPILLIGLLLAAIPAWSMAHWTVDVRPIDVVVANFVQGIAAGAIWAPLNILTLSRLDRRVQDQGFALFYLNFDAGYAIGAAGIIALHARHSQINHAVLNEAINPYNELLRYARPSELWDIAEASGLTALDAEITRQATMIAYNNSFLVSALVICALIPLILLFRHRAPTAAPQAPAAPPSGN